MPVELDQVIAAFIEAHIRNADEVMKEQGRRIHPLINPIAWLHLQRKVSKNLAHQSRVCAAYRDAGVIPEDRLLLAASDHLAAGGSAAGEVFALEARSFATTQRTTHAEIVAIAKGLRQDRLYLGAAYSDAVRMITGMEEPSLADALRSAYGRLDASGIDDIAPPDVATAVLFAGVLWAASEAYEFTQIAQNPSLIKPHLSMQGPALSL